MKKTISLVLYAFFITASLLTFRTARAAESAEAESPYSFRLEWALLNPDDGSEKKASPVAVIWLEPLADYHTYSPQPGEDAFPTRVTFANGQNVELRYLPGEAKPDVFDPDIIVNVYEGLTPVFAVFDSDFAPVEDTINVSLLACSDVRCFPVKTSIPVSPPSTWENVPAASSLPWFETFGQSRALAPLSAEVPSETSLSMMSDSSDLNIAPTPPLLREGAPNVTSVIESSTTAEIPAELSSAGSLTSVVSTSGSLWNFAPKPFQESLEVSSLAKAILFGLIAGLILNIMPCVLPVITLKITALLAFGGEPEERRQRFREHNLLFSAGILTWFIALALLFSMADMAWGQLFQNPTIIFAVLIVVFCLGLAMFDVFHLPVLDLRLGSSSANPKIQAFSTGVLATLLATPCSGPLLGGVLGWSLMQSLPVLMTVFIATGVGMALPYLLMAYKPDFANRLPHPGPWMLICERILGFLLMGTCLYFLSILPQDRILPALAVLLSAAAGAWVWGRWGSLRSLGRRCLVGVLSLSLILLTAVIAFRQPDDPVRWQTYQDETFREMLGKQPLLVEFTADWCPTCRVLEKTVLTTENLRPLAKEYGMTLVQVDMTLHEPAAQELLRALGSASIPLLAIFPAGTSANQPVVLRDIYTSTQLREAVKQAMKFSKMD